MYVCRPQVFEEVIDPHKPHVPTPMTLGKHGIASLHLMLSCTEYCVDPDTRHFCVRGPFLAKDSMTSCMIEARLHYISTRQGTINSFQMHPVYR